MKVKNAITFFCIRVMRAANLMNLLLKNKNVLMYVLESRELVSSGIINITKKEKKNHLFQNLATCYQTFVILFWQHGIYRHISPPLFVNH